MRGWRIVIRPFDIENERLFRAEIVTADDGDYQLFDIHHLVFDGSSIKVLLNDIARAYDGKPLEEEALTIFDISVYEKKLRGGRRCRAAQAFFEKMLSGLDVDSRPVSDVIEPSPQKGAGRITLSLGDSLTIAQADRHPG